MNTKLKTPARSRVCESLEMTQAAIREIGDIQRTLSGISATANDEIAVITERAAQLGNPLRERLAALQEAVQIWCEANRSQICGAGKSANLITGEVSWRINPPSVRLTGEAKVIERLQAAGLHDFVRTKESVNKEAVLERPLEVKHITGIKVISGVEVFAIEPFEVEVTGGA